MAAHALVLLWLSRQLGSLAGSGGEGLQRIEVAFVQDLLPREPVLRAPSTRPAQAPGRGVAARPAATAARPAATATQPAASATQPAADTASAAPGTSAVAEPQDLAARPPDPAPEPSALATAPLQPVPTLPPTERLAVPAAPAADALARQADTPLAAPAEAASSAAATAASEPFEWPPSTRLSYVLSGDYRGPVHGTAQVEWLRSGERYQVHLEVSVGPLLSRRMSSEGRLTAQGLQPLRYEEVTRALLREPRRQSLRFEADHVLLANGHVQPTMPQVQDTASQFVQLTWLFTTQSHRLRQGQTIEMPLALPRRVDRWMYDIQAEETLDTPLGPLQAFHMKPRRSVPLPGELVIESWFAPALQYLPVRILIRQDAQTFIDLQLARAPQQAAPAPVKSR
ncbi:MAG: DUF3108 domain-containing protein [Rubrivivax sp.]|nr:DUF3108 domain-containing protein [Rubrivivax sp.]